MSNKNFGEPWEGKIERIRENLGEGRYAPVDGIFPIVKELIQNAEDARATKLLIAWVEGLPKARHPLLRTAGLLAINDGGFDAANGRAIREMGLSSKAADSSTIGKFGLGMKSVFHLGEIFLFVAVDESGHRIDADIRSPWSADEGGLHPDWDDFCEDDVHAVEARVRSLFGPGRWFCLWVPLRRREHCRGVDPIEPFFPGDRSPDDLFGLKQLGRVPTLLPLLAHLETIEIALANGQRFGIQIDSGSSRRIALDARRVESSPTPRAFAGKITSTRSGAILQHLYSGKECCPRDQQLTEIAAHEKWPRRFATDPNTGRSRQVQEKAWAHAAACCVASRMSGSHGELRLHWAVFLPLGQPKSIEITDCAWSVDIFLHGWFFPNSGRTAVEAIEEEESETPLAVSDAGNSGTVRRNWNQRLARCGTLLLVPSAFAAVAEQCRWDDQATAKITHALQHSPLFTRFAADICKRDGWVRRLVSDGGSAWQRIPANTTVYEIPGADSGADVCVIFPEMREIAATDVIVARGSPRLMAASTERWPNHLVSKLLRSASSDRLVKSPISLDYVVRFLDESAPEQAWSVHADDLVDLARSMLMESRRPIEGESRKAIRRFLARLPSNRRIRLRLEQLEGAAAEIFVVLCESTASINWVPDEFASADSTCSGQLAAGEALYVLQKLSKWGQRSLTSAETERLGVIAAQMFRATTDLATLLATAGNIELFNGIRCRDRRKESGLSWSDIVEHHRRRVLFVKPSPMAYQLQEALPDENIVLISKELSEAIFGESGNGPAQCREGQLLAALTVAEKPKLGGVSSRRPLFESLLKFRDGRREPSFRNCLRYLLHGNPEYFSASDSLLVQGATGTVWWRLAKLSLEALGQRWRIVDATFSTIISDDDRRELGVAIVDAEVALDLATKVDPQCFATLGPSELEYRDLLKQISDDDLLRKLPIHEERGGAFTAIGEDCFWESDRTLPDGLEHNVRVLKRAAGEGVWKRQQQLASPLNSAAVMKIALAQQVPGSHWALIMDCVNECDHVSTDTINRLKTTAWVPATVGNWVKPEDIVHLPELQDDVARLVSQYPGVFVDPERLAPPIRRHAGFARLLSIAAPAGSDALGMVGTLLLEDDRNCVGNVAVEFDDWLDAFHNDTGELFPCISFLRKASQKLPGGAHVTFRELAKPINETRTRELLDWLRAAHRSERAAGRRAKIVFVFGCYLRSFLTADNFAEQFDVLQLPAKDGSWRYARELCTANDGVAPCHVVDPDIEKVIADVLPSALKDGSPFSDGGNSQRLREPDWQVEAAAPRLREFFDTWRDVIPNEQIGGFLALLGDDTGVRSLAQEFLGRNRTLEETREKFGLPDVQCGRDPTTGMPVMEDAETMIRKQRVVVEIARDAVVDVLNLLGKAISVPRNERPSTLFVGYGSRVKPFPQQIYQGIRVLCFRLNAIDPGQFSEHELGLLLRDSAAKFIVEAYNSFEHQTKFMATWDDLAASDQLDIRITQSRIIEHGFLILDQYGLRADPELARVLDLWDTAERLKAERETKAEKPRQGPRRNPEQELQAAREQLRNVLENRPETQQQILAAVRHRIADYYQYKPDSVPFELFQNADDAYVELSRFFPAAADALRGTDVFFEVVASDNHLAFIHLGRRINQYPIEQDHEASGFDNDLWKMSVLSLSNKGHSADVAQAPVTGKFGLGFKSVFLACDRPRILSGRLAFEFVGGIYPRRLRGDERRTLDDLRQQQAQGNQQATVLELDLREGIDAELVIGRFRTLAHILVVFARQIRCCITEHGGTPTRWQPTDVPGVSDCQSGELLPLHQGGAARLRAIVFRSDAGDLLFALGSRGFERFEAGIPTIWVTAPTEENLGLGFLVNGRFALDVGRAQLARDPAQNAEVALRLGRQFGEKLAQLCRAFDEPATRSEISRVLRFATDTTPYQLWNSLWDLLVQSVSEGAHRDEPAERLIRDVLWGSTQTGAAGFIAAYPVIPVRLPGKRFESELVALHQIRFSVSGILSQGDGYALACVCEWPEVKERLGQGRLVSHEEVIAPLRVICPRLVAAIKTIGIAEAIGWELTHTTVTPVQADRLGELVTRKFLDECDKTEQQHMEGQLRTLEFKALDGRYYPSEKLVIGHAPRGHVSRKHDDERLRAAFAPTNHVLSPEYTVKGLAFFDASRRELVAPPRELAYWVLAASDRPRRQAALRYLADGDLGAAVQEELKRRGIEGTWLENLVGCEEFDEMTTQQKGRLLGLLPQADAEEIIQKAVEQSPPQTVDAEHSLRAILAWWKEQRAWRIAEYERQVFPNGPLSFLTNAEDAQAYRKDWVILFLLGLTHTMGRAQAEAHRGFLRQCERDGRLDMIASSERDPGRWMTWIDDYLDRQIDESKFLQWMKQFVGIYQVSRHLDDYIEAFLAVARFKSPFALTQVSNTKASSAHQGGGVSAPPLSRVLGMGQCFILRELMRHGVLKNPLAYRHCYVPVGRVRRMFLTMGCDGLLNRQRPWEWSSTIHSFLRDKLGSTDAATFHGDFDIPLQIIAEDKELQARFFSGVISPEDEDEENVLWSEDGEEPNGGGD